MSVPAVRPRRPDDGVMTPGAGPGPTRRVRRSLPSFPVEQGTGVRRGRRATGDDQSFGSLVGWTLLGAFIPGSGLIAAGRRRLGWGFFAGFAALAAVAAYFLLTGDVVGRLGDVLARPGLLLAIAAVLLASLAAWVFMVLLTFSELRRFVDLSRVQFLLSTLLVCSLIAMVGVPVVKAGSYAMILRDTVGGIFSSNTGGSVGNVAANGTAAWSSQPRVNVLLIGSDAGADRVGIRPDTLILASINTKTGDTVLISLPRNLQKVPFPAGSPQAEQYPNGFDCVDAAGAQQCLLNAFWTFGEDNWQTYYKAEPSAFDAGLRATADAVQEVTGLGVDQYVMVNLRGFMQVINAFGGVTVNVYERLPIGGSSSNPVASEWIEPGLNQHLDGYHALWYARSRWSTDDFDRMRRQRCLIGAVVDQVDPATVARAFPEIAAAAKDNIITGIPQADVGAWVSLAKEVKNAKVRSLAFTSRVIDTTDPDFDLMHQMVQYAIDPSAPAPSVSPSSKPSQTPTEQPTPTPSAESSASVGPSAPPKEDASGTAQDVNSVC